MRKMKSALAALCVAALFMGSGPAVARAKAVERYKAMVDNQSFRVIRYDNGSVKVVDGGVFGDGVSYNPRLPPSDKAIVTGSARAIAFGKITPRRAGSEHPENAVQHATIIHARNASRLVGQKRLDHTPLEVGQIISAHADAESDFGA